MKLLLPLILLTSTGTFTSCSSSDDGNNQEQNDNKAQSLAGVWTIGNYTMTMYNNNTFDAVDNTNQKQYGGIYSYSGDILTLSGVKTRAFTLEEGKTYTFEVKREGNTITITNTETNETFTGTYVAEAPQKSAYLSPEEEKAFIEAQARSLEAYFDPGEWHEYANVSKELRKVKDGDLGDFAEEFIQSTLTGSTSHQREYYSWAGTNYDNNGTAVGTIWELYQYTVTNEYWDRCLMMSNMQGEFTATYNGKWTRTKKDGDLTMKYTAQDGAQWVLTVQKSGSSGRIKAENEDHWDWTEWVPEIGPNDKVVIKKGEPSTYVYEDEYIDIPTHVTATLTRNGEERVKAVVNIDEFGNKNAENGELTLIGQSKGNANIYIKPKNDAFTVSTDFNYLNGGNSTCNATVKKGNTTLLAVSAACTPTATSATEISNVTNISATATILNELTAHFSTANGKTLVNAMEDCDSKDQASVEKAKETINNNIAAFITNSPANDAVQQATIKMGVKSWKDWEYYWDSSNYVTHPYEVTRYGLTPTINFSDGTSYAFPDYFTEYFFKGVIDKAETIVKDVENMLK